MDGEHFDSDVERTLANKWERANTEWKLVLNNDVFNLDAEIMIPDFAIGHPDDRRAILEIVGFWTPGLTVAYYESRLSTSTWAVFSNRNDRCIGFHCKES